MFEDPAHIKKNKDALILDMRNQLEASNATQAQYSELLRNTQAQLGAALTELAKHQEERLGRPSQPEETNQISQPARTTRTSRHEHNDGLSRTDNALRSSRAEKQEPEVKLETPAIPTKKDQWQHFNRPLMSSLQSHEDEDKPTDREAAVLFVGEDHATPSLRDMRMSETEPNGVNMPNLIEPKRHCVSLRAHR